MITNKRGGVIRLSKSQAALEFSILIVLAFIVITMVVSTIGYRIKEQQKLKEIQSMEDLESLLLTEFRLAANSEPGFEKEFELPKLLSGKPYTIEFNYSFKEITINLDNIEYVVFIPTDLALEGNLSPGRNKVIRLSDKVVFNTLEAVDTIPPAMINDLTVTDAGMDWVELSWTAVGDDNYQGAADHYLIAISTTPITDSNWDSLNITQLGITPQENGSLELFMLQGLSPGTGYYFAIRAVDDANNQGPLSNNAFGITLPRIGFYALGDNLTVFSVENNSINDLIEYPIEGDNLLLDYKTLYLSSVSNPGIIEKYIFNQLGNITLNSSNSLAQVLDMSLGNNLLVSTSNKLYILDTSLQELGSIDLPNIRLVKSYTPNYALASQIMEGGNSKINLVNITNPNDMNVLSYMDLGYGELSSLDIRNQMLIASIKSYIPSAGSIYLINLSNTSNMKIVENHTLDCRPISTAVNGLLLLVTCYKDELDIPKLLIFDNALNMLFETQEINMSAFGYVSLLSTIRDVAVVKAGDYLVFINISDPFNSSIQYSYPIQSNINSVKGFDYEGVVDSQPPANVRDLNIKDKDYFNITLNWTSVGDDNYSGRVLHYDLRFSIFNISNSWDYAEKVLPPPRPELGGEEQEFTIQNLIPGVNYYIALKAVDSSGNWNEMSNIVNTTTKPAILKLNASSIYNSSWDNLSCFLQPELPQDIATTIYSWSSSSGFKPKLLLAFDSKITEQVYGNIRDYSQTTNVTLGLPSNPESIPEWISDGRFGGAYSFDGGDIIIADEAPDLKPSDEFTFEAWIKPLYGGTIFDNHKQEDSTSQGFMVRINKLDSNTANLELIVQQPGDEAQFFDSNQPLSLNEWHHIVVVRSYNNKRFYGYIDGNMVINITDDYSFNNENNIGIGANYNDTTAQISDGFSGFIDEVRYYPIALSHDQILLHSQGIYNKISGSETTSGDVWKCRVVINQEMDMVELESNNLTITGELLLVTWDENSHHGLKVYEFDDAHNLSLVDTIELSGVPHGFCVGSNDEKSVFFNDGSGVGIINISRPKTLRLVNYVDLNINSTRSLVGDLVCTNNTIYSSFSYNGIFSLTKDLQPISHDDYCDGICHGSFFSLAEYNNTITLADIEVAYASFNYSRLLLFYNRDFTYNGSLTLINRSTRMVYDKTRELLFTGEMYYEDYFVRMYNLSTLNQPSLEQNFISEYQTSSRVTALAIENNTLFVGTSFNSSKDAQVFAFNVSNQNLELLANITITSNISDIYDQIIDISVVREHNSGHNKSYIALAAQDIGFYVLEFNNTDFRIKSHGDDYGFSVLFLKDKYRH